MNLKINQLTFTRFIASLSILIFHFGRGVFPFSNPHISVLSNDSNLGVSYFFILSGFVMIIAYSGKETIKAGIYYTNRFVRIYPLYLVALILSVILMAKGTFNLIGFILQLLLLQSWVPEHILSYNIAAWSLSVELLFYLLFPILFNIVYKKLSLKAVTIVISGFWLASMASLLFSNWFRSVTSLESHSNFMFYSPIFHLNEFLMGNLGALVFMSVTKEHRKFKENLTLPVVLFLCGTLLAIVIKSMGFKKEVMQLLLHDGLLVLLFLPLIMALSFNKGLVSKLFSLKPFIFLGDISYGVYILQFPVYIIWINGCQYFSINNRTWIFYSFVLVLIAISSVAHVSIEKPLNQWVRKMQQNHNP